MQNQLIKKRTEHGRHMIAVDKREVHKKQRYYATVYTILKFK